MLLVATIAALALNAALNYALVPMAGFTGAGMARTGANAFFVVLLVMLGRRYLHWHFPWASFLKLCLVSALAAGAGLAVEAFSPLHGLLHLAAIGGAFALVLLPGLYVAGEVPKGLLRR